MYNNYTEFIPLLLYNYVENVNVNLYNITFNAC